MPKLSDIKGFFPYITIVFLNAFVDLGHKIIVQNTIFKVYDGQTQIILTAIVNALILIPFILLFSPAGFLSDKYPKNKVMRYSAWAVVGATLLITACYYAGWFWAAFLLTLGLAIQSAIYSPAKYGYIKELVGNENLARANGAVQATTITGILLGTFVFSGLFEAFFQPVSATDTDLVMKDIAPVGWLLVAFAVFELALTYLVPQKTQTQKSAHFSMQQYANFTYLKTNLNAVKGKLPIWLSIIGLATFWAISQVLLAAFPAFAKETLDQTNTLVIQGILACSGLGIIIGSIIAGRVSRTYIETGLIPVGAFGVTLSLLLIPTLDTQLTMALAFLGLGIMGGFFIIPLNALIQYHAKEHELGTVLAGNNWVQNIAMLSFLIITVILAKLGFTSVSLFLLLTVVALLGTGYTIKKLPHSLARIVVSFLFKQRYRISVNGFRNMPAEGAVLLLGNHISWIDWALVQIACPRPVRFVMQREIYNLWYLKPIFKLFGVIPIAKGKSAESLKAINEQLQQGEVVCLFPEGAISRNGQLGKFHSGYERTIEGVESGVIIPFYLRGLWGSAFSRSNEKLRESRSPKGMRRDIIVAFGQPLALTTPTDELKQKVSELSISAWEDYVDTLDPIPLTWLKTARQNGSRACVIDNQGEKFSYKRMLIATLAFAKAIRKQAKGQNVGVVLPASSANVIANLAVMLTGKTAVNLNYTASVDAVKAGISNAQVQTIYTSKRFIKKLQQRGIDTEAMFSAADVIFMEDVKASFSKFSLAMAWLKSFLPVSLLYPLAAPRDLNQPAAILFSSGSEGTPKGIVLSHRNIMANCKQISDVLNMRDDDVIIGSLPPFHSFGLTATAFMPVLEGLPLVCHPDPTDVVNIAKAIARYRATILCATATFLRLYSKNKRIDPLMLEPLRIVVAGAEKLNQATREGFERKFNKTIYEGYGATETTPVASVNVPDAIDTAYWRVQHGNRPGTVGLPLPGSTFRVVDPETLETLPLGEDGLILISGTQVMLGYLNDPEKTQDVIVELDGRRWYKTGDKGHLTQEGFLKIVDRYSRFAKIGGEMISLSAVEEKVREILTDDEMSLAALNVPDEKKGEKIVLFIEKNSSGETPEPTFIRQQLIEGNMDNLLLPSTIVLVDEVPRLGTGKTDYKGVQALAETALP